MATKRERYYFAQVGAELIPITAEDVELQKKGASFSTSAPVRNFVVRDFIKGTKYEGSGDDWAAAESDTEAQQPKG